MSSKESASGKAITKTGQKKKKKGEDFCSEAISQTHQWGEVSKGPDIDGKSPSVGYIKK